MFSLCVRAYPLEHLEAQIWPGANYADHRIGKSLTRPRMHSLVRPMAGPETVPGARNKSSTETDLGILCREVKGDFATQPPLHHGIATLYDPAGPCLV